MKILVLDDEADIREILAFNLEASGFEVREAGTAEAVLEMLHSGERFDLMLVDVMLPGMSGFKLVLQLRQKEGCDVPVIFLTARSSENDLLTGFSAGGDDFISKPFSVNEVLARVKAVLKRSSVDRAAVEQLTLGDLHIDLLNKKAFLRGVALPLSRKEYDILQLLATNRSRTYSRKELIAELWKESPYVLERTVDVHIARLRSKLGDYRGMISNRAGFGYSFECGD